MKWNYLNVIAEMGIEGQPCTVCGKMETDIIYFPDAETVSDYQLDWIKKIWKCDPYEDFTVCMDCMRNHSGFTELRSFNADTWLEKHIEEFKKTEGVFLKLN